MGLLFFIFWPVRVDDLGGSHLAWWGLLIWFICESLFFPYYLILFTIMNQRNRALKHVARCNESRTRLLMNCFNAMANSALEGSTLALNPVKYLRKVIEGWHFDTPLEEIYRENFQGWMAWAFFGKDIIGDMTNMEKIENEKLTSYVEEQINWRFREGHNGQVMSARLTLDPVFATQRPFFFYATIFIVNQLCHGALSVLGYQKLSRYCTSAQNVYMRKAVQSDTKRDKIRGNNGKSNISSDCNDNGNLSSGSDINNEKNKKKLPVFFIHGIGIGFAHYLSLISALPIDVDVYLLEWPHVAMQMTTAVPSIQETVSILIAVLQDHGHEAAIFLAHSLGTTAVSWMLHHEVGRKLVSGTVLLDPVTFLLCDPTVARSFVYRNPTNTIDFLMHFFISRELFISNALSRHFNWSHNIMFAEDFIADEDRTRSMSGTPQNERGMSDGETSAINPNNKPTFLFENANNATVESSSLYTNGIDTNDGENFNHPSKMRHCVILSSDDSIVPIGSVSRYLEAKSVEFARNGKKCFEVLMFHGHHGEMMLYPSWIKTITSRVTGLIKNGNDS